jgi:hypothetical protein
MKKIFITFILSGILFLYASNPTGIGVTGENFTIIPPKDVYASTFEGKEEYIEMRLEEKRIETERLKLEEDLRIEQEKLRLAEEKRIADEKIIAEEKKKTEIKNLAIEKKKAEEKKKLEEQKKMVAEEATLAKAPMSNSSLNASIYNYMSNKTNRASVLQRTLKLNGGSYTNSCTYFASEVLRRVGLNLSDSLATTDGLASKLSSLGWKKYNDYKSLEKGDVVFSMGPQNRPGRPTHTYIFMGWVKSGDYNYGYIVDNQGNKYGDVYHTRNIAILASHNGDQKEAFQYFMRK